MVNKYDHGNSKDKGFGSVDFVAPVVGAVGGQAGRVLLAHTGYYTRWEVTAAGLVAGILANYMAVSADSTKGGNMFFKPVSNRMENGRKLSTAEAKCYRHRGGIDSGYWINAWCYGNSADTMFVVGYDTLLQMVVQVGGTVLMGGNLKEALSAAAGLLITAEGYSAFINTGYNKTPQSNYDGAPTRATYSAYAVPPSSTSSTPPSTSGGPGPGG